MANDFETQVWDALKTVRFPGMSRDIVSFGFVHTVKAHDGVVSVIEALKGHPLFAHVTLSRSERSAIAMPVRAAVSHSKCATRAVESRRPQLISHS